MMYDVIITLKNQEMLRVAVYAEDMAQAISKVEQGIDADISHLTVEPTYEELYMVDN